MSAKNASAHIIHVCDTHTSLCFYKYNSIYYLMRIMWGTTRNGSSILPELSLDVKYAASGFRQILHIIQLCWKYKTKSVNGSFGRRGIVELWANCLASASELHSIWGSFDCITSTRVNTIHCHSVRLLQLLSYVETVLEDQQSRNEASVCETVSYVRSVQKTYPPTHPSVNATYEKFRKKLK